MVFEVNIFDAQLKFVENAKFYLQNSCVYNVCCHIPWNALFWTTLEIFGLNIKHHLLQWLTAIHKTFLIRLTYNSFRDFSPYHCMVIYFENSPEMGITFTHFHLNCFHFVAIGMSCVCVCVYICAIGRVI